MSICHDRVLVAMILTSAVFNEEQQCLATNITDHNLVELSFIQSLLFQLRKLYPYLTNLSIGAQFFKNYLISISMHFSLVVSSCSQSRLPYTTPLTYTNLKKNCTEKTGY